MSITRITAAAFVVALATMLLAGPAGARPVEATDWSRVASGVQREVDASVAPSRQAWARQFREQPSADAGGDFPWATSAIAGVGLVLLGVGTVTVTRRRRGAQLASMG